MASLSIDDMGSDRYKLRWREVVAGPDGRPERGADGRLVRKSRSLTVVGKTARDEAVGRIRRALVEEGRYEIPAVSETRIANLETVAGGWLVWKRSRCTPSSCQVYGQHAERLVAAIRKIRKVRDDEEVGVDELSRDLITRAIRSWQEEGLSEASVYAFARSALEMWRWAGDDHEQWPGVPTPPREPKALLPRPPIYVAPPAPTLAEADACLRHLPLDALQSRRIGTFLRYTGLRVQQVTAFRRRDLDLAHGMLTITTGKSRAEKAAHRTVPAAKALIAEVRAWVEPLAEGALLFPKWGIADAETSASIRPELFRAAWQEATRFGEAREIAWKPANRLIGRPEHAFRSAFQAALREGGTSDEVIDALVGHHGHTTRDRHYAGHMTLLDRMCEAVDALPAIDWNGPKVLTLIGRRKRVT